MSVRLRASSALWRSETKDQDESLICNRKLRCLDLDFSSVFRVQRAPISASTSVHSYPPPPPPNSSQKSCLEVSQRHEFALICPRSRTHTSQSTDWTSLLRFCHLKHSGHMERRSAPDSSKPNFFSKRLHLHQKYSHCWQAAANLSTALHNMAAAVS